MKKRFSFFLLLALCLSACQADFPRADAQTQTGPTTLTPTPFQVASATFRPTATLTPTVTATATPLPCREKQGHIEQQEQVFGNTSTPLKFRVYFPPCYQQDGDVRYPVLYMIHGQTFQEDQWPRLGIGDAADALINEKEAPPFLIVMPLEKDTYADIYLTPFSRQVIDGLIPWIDAQYPTCTERICRAIGGLSRGGAWAMRLGFTNWELFGSIGMHSTPPFNTDPALFPSWVSKIPEDELPRVYMDIGRKDPFLSNATDFEGLLVRYNVPHEWYLFNGTHEEAYWSAHVSEYLSWYVQPWQEMAEDLIVH